MPQLLLFCVEWVVKPEPNPSVDLSGNIMVELTCPGRSSSVHADRSITSHAYGLSRWRDDTVVRARPGMGRLLYKRVLTCETKTITQINSRRALSAIDRPRCGVIYFTVVDYIFIISAN